MTVFPPQHQATSPCYTHAIALGRKDDDHDETLALFHAELVTLSKCNLMYSKATNTQIPVVVKLLVIVANHPERCVINNIRSHTGMDTKCWM